MTAEKKKPVEDEISDEQLKDVAGGGVAGPGSVGVNMAAEPTLNQLPKPSVIPTPVPDIRTP